MGIFAKTSPVNSGIELNFFTRLSLKGCITALRDHYQNHPDIRLKILPSDLMPGAAVVAMEYQRYGRVTGRYVCLLRPWENGETLVEGPTEVSIHQDRQHPLPSRAALFLGAVSWLILLGTALMLQYEAFRALAFAGFALFTGLALVIVGMTASAEVFSSPDTYLLRDMIKTTLTVRVVKYEIPKISPTAALRMARRPAHITGRSPLAVDKQRGRLPPNHFPSGR